MTLSGFVSDVIGAEMFTLPQKTLGDERFGMG